MIKVRPIRNILDLDYELADAVVTRHHQAQAEGQSPFMLYMLATEAQNHLKRARVHLQSRRAYQYN